MKSWLLKMTAGDSINRKIFRAAVVVGLLTAVVKSGAMVKELIVARWFGRSDALDAFLIAFLLPSFLLGLVMGGLESALIPTFIRVRQAEGTEAAQKLFSSILLLSLFLLLATALLLSLLAPLYLPYLGSGFSPEKLRLTRELLYALLPFIVFSGIAMCASAVLNAGERFALPALTPMLTPLVTILFVELGAGKWSTFTLAAGAVIGSALEAAFLLRSLRAQGIHFSLRWHGLDPATRSVIGQYAPMLAGAFLVGSTSIVDQSMAAMLPAGSVAALNYAYKVISVILALGAAALGSAALPYFSKMVAENDWNGCRHTLKKYSLLIVAVAVPLTAGLMIFSKPLVRLLFQRGAFSPADTQLVSWVQICYAIQIPFYIWARLFIRFLSAIRRNDVLMYCSGINLVLDIVLNLVLMRIWGVAGIALSTSLVYVAIFLFLALWSVRLLRQQSLSVSVAASVERSVR